VHYRRNKERNRRTRNPQTNKEIHERHKSKKENQKTNWNNTLQKSRHQTTKSRQEREKHPHRQIQIFNQFPTNRENIS